MSVVYNTLIVCVLLWKKEEKCKTEKNEQKKEQKRKEARKSRKKKLKYMTILYIVCASCLKEKKK